MEKPLRIGVLALGPGDGTKDAWALGALGVDSWTAVDAYERDIFIGRRPA